MKIRQLADWMAVKLKSGMLASFSTRTQSHIWAKLPSLAFWFLVSSISSTSLTLFLSFHSCHTHSFPPPSSLASFHVLLLLSPQSAFLQQAIGFTSATSILRVTAVVTHKAETLCCDVARCPTAALHNPVWRLCWLDWPVFTQAPGACCDPAAAALRGRLAVHSFAHRRALEGRSWCFELQNPCGTFFCSWIVRLYCKLHSVTYITTVLIRVTVQRGY